LLLLESAQTKKSAAALKRDAEQMPRRAEALVAHLVPSGPPKVVVVRSCAYAPGMIIAVDLPFAAVRNMCTFLMTKLSSPNNTSTRQEFDALVAASDRRATKLLLTQLLAYAQSINSCSSKPQMPAGKTAPIEAFILVLFIYSIPGDQVDLLRIDAKAVCDRLELLKSLSPSASY